MALLAIYSYTTHAQIITENFNYTGAPVIWTVPSCVDSISITIAGAEGGGSDPGQGATLNGYILVTPDNNFN